MSLQRLKLLAGLVAIALVAAFLHYTLPSRDVVRIVGTDVVREDVQRIDSEGRSMTLTHDVRYIYAKWPDDGDRVYRNEDTGWGWPPYLKFDTGNLAARAADLASTAEAPKLVVVRHYGWRIPLFSMYPNALSIRNATGPDEELTPWFNIVFVTMLVLIVLIVRRLSIIMFQRHVDPVIEQIDREIDETTGAVTRRYRRAWRWLRQTFGI